MKYLIILIWFCFAVFVNNLTDSVLYRFKLNETNDSVRILVTSKPLDQELGYTDSFGNYYSLQKGVNVVASPVVVTDLHWKHQTKFPLNTTIKEVILDKDLSNGFWSVKSKDKNVKVEVNFDEIFRKEIAPIKDFGASRPFLKVKYIDNPLQREEDINDYYERKILYLRKYAAINKLSVKFLNQWDDTIE